MAADHFTTFDAYVYVGSLFINTKVKSCTFYDTKCQSISESQGEHKKKYTNQIRFLFTKQKRSSGTTQKYTYSSNIFTKF